MDPFQNPFSPGAGAPPPELAGRERVRQQTATALARIRVGRSAKSVVLVGLRGVGKTVLLDSMREAAEAADLQTLRLEMPEDRSLLATLAPQLRLALLRMSRMEAAKHGAERALRALAGFAKAFKVKYADLEVGIDLEPEPGLADNGNLQEDLAALLMEAGKAARAARTAVVLFLDELQFVKEEQFGALIMALHRCAQDRLPVTLVGAGLPQLRMIAGNAKSYAERLFDFLEIGALSEAEAKLAIVKPAREQGIAFTDEAVQRIVEETRGYPYFLQEWGKHAWDIAEASPITLRDVAIGAGEAIAALDESFFRVRFDRLTPAEKKYLRAMAELGDGTHRSGEIAAVLGKKTQAYGKLRDGLIAKGMVWSPSYGDTAFSVPLFAGFMQRIMPGESWRLD